MQGCDLHTKIQSPIFLILSHQHSGFFVMGCESSSLLINLLRVLTSRKTKRSGASFWVAQISSSREFSSFLKRITIWVRRESICASLNEYISLCKNLLRGVSPYSFNKTDGASASQCAREVEWKEIGEEEENNQVSWCIGERNYVFQERSLLSFFDIKRFPLRVL